MTTKKKGYVKPIIATEEFVPQEYVAVCQPEPDGSIIILFNLSNWPGWCK